MFPIRIVFYCQKGSTLMDEFNKIVSMMESGHIIKVDGQMGCPAQNHVGRGDNSGEYYIFTTAYLLVAFYMFLLGQSFSFIVPGWDVIWQNKYRSHLQNNKVFNEQVPLSLTGYFINMFLRIDMQNDLLKIAWTVLLIPWDSHVCFP